jgi:diguanylate cyclase (GGDEF)-like protein
MKLPRVTRSNLLLIRFPAILVLFAAMMVIGSQNIASITDGISMHLFKSARYEEATRAEMEFNDLLGKAYRYSSGDSSVRDVDIALALDIFWSRVNVLKTRSYRDALTGAGVVETSIIPDLFAALPKLEKAVQVLRFDQPATYAEMGQFAIRYQADIAHYSDKAYSARRNQMRGMVEREIDSLDNLKILQFEYAGLACLTFLYVLFELYLSRRGNRKLNLAMEEKQHLLISDHLTGIGNRRHFETALQTRSISDNFSLVMLDLDGFKAVNDTLGHAAGDHLLRHVASILLSTCGMDDVVCRLGGDEFAVLLKGSKERAGAFANRIMQRLADPVLFEGNPIKAATSIGVAHSSDMPITTTGCMLRNADAALYAAKAAGRNCVQFTSSTLTSASNRKRKLQADLKPAILDSRIDVAYQPIVSLSTGETKGIEALVRWNHPEFGAVPALEIIEVAEQTNQILPLTLHVIDHACKTRNHMAACGHDILVTANVSPGLMALPAFAQAVGEVAKRHDMQRGQLLLELTEDAMMAESEIVEQNIEYFRTLGIYLVVDDFGKGYSNLSRLANREFSKVKLDKSLVDGITTSDRSLGIARGISRMAIELGINVVAEGIEGPDQTAVLLELGITLGQGFHYARPMSALSLLAYLDRPTPAGSASGENLQLKAG